MSKIKNETIVQEQAKVKPKIEDIIATNLDGDMKRIALDFIAYLRVNKLNPVKTSAYCWKVNYKGKRIFTININKQSWFVLPYFDYINDFEDFVLENGLQNVYWDNIYYCVAGRGCNPKKSCAGGTTTIFFGKEIKGICSCRIFAWLDKPSETEINGIKILSELERQARAKS